MKRVFIFLAFAVCTQTIAAQSWPDTVALINKMLSFYEPQNPGCQLSISREGKVIFSRAWGMADLERNVPLSLTSIIEAGSVSKQFTAAAILLLEQQGKLSQQDDVRKFIPELPQYGPVITLSHMIHHTSGLRDWGAIAQLSGWPRTTKAYSNDDALAIIARQKKLNNKPGDEFLYSNSNYNLLAIVVQRVSGISLAEYTRQHIFVPAGMMHTQWRNDYEAIVPGRAIAYTKVGTVYKMDMPNESAYGNGGLLTTTEDLLKWNEYYLSGKFGTPSLLPKQLSMQPLNNGLPNNYAAGLSIHNTKGLELIEHEGATAGYRALLECYPQQQLSVAFLSNTSQFDSKRNAIKAIKDIFVDQRPGDRPPGPKTLTLAEEILRQYTGWYSNKRSGEGMQVSFHDKKLYKDNNSPLSPVAENIFRDGNSFMHFQDKKLLYITPEKDSIEFETEQPANLTAAMMNDYTGEYFSDETESKIIIALRGDRLEAELKIGKRFILFPTYKDAFKMNIGHLHFLRNAEGQVDQLNISVPRRVEFVRKL